MSLASALDVPQQGRIAELRAADGYLLKYRIWEPNSGGSAVIVLLNGVMSHSLWFYPLSRALVGAGFKLVGADRRGSGLNLDARGDAPNAQTLLQDIRAIVERERAGQAKVHLVGWCWGAVLAINLAAELRSSVASLVLLAPGLFPTDTLKRRMSAQEATARASAETELCLQSPISEDMFTSGPALNGFILKDEHRLERFTPRFLKIMGKLALGAHLALPKLGVPMLLVMARHDLATDNAETELNFRRLTAGRAEFEILDSAHGMQFDVPDELAGTIRDFIIRAPSREAQHADGSS